MLTVSIEALKQRIQQFPNEKCYVEQLANLYTQMKDWRSASECYEKIIIQNKADANDYFNYAYNLRFLEEYDKSIEQYYKSLALKISQPEEVYLNIAVIYSDYLRLENFAIEALNSALLLNNNYIPALYNLGNLHEDFGKKDKASQLFERIIEIQPQYYDALARLAQIKKFSDPNHLLIKKLINANADPHINLSVKININFALGKAFDDCQHYNEAFRYFKEANNLDKKINKPYDQHSHQRYVDQIMTVFDSKYLQNIPKLSDAAPVFICGMFRSGSTLIEQILAAHSNITAGGEQEFFIRLVTDELNPYPTSLLKVKFNQLKDIAEDYLSDISTKFPNADIVTDKRPENYLYIGLIKVLFPNARFIFTQRNILDNCLSIYFLRLGKRMNYSLDLKDIAEHYELHNKLMTFWQEKFKDSIYTVNYEKLVSNSTFEIKKLITFLNLDWDPNCLNFYNVDNRVKTASVWQVRKPLYSSSSGRWKNYEANIDVLSKYFK